MNVTRLDGEPNRARRWVSHAGHGAVLAAGPHAARPSAWRSREDLDVSTTPRLITLDGSEGEGGGQILRTALTLSLWTGRPFRLVKVARNRDKPGLRPQHLAALQAAATLGNAEVSGAEIGARDITFRPGEYQTHDLDLDIGTAGATALVLQTLHLPLALRAEGPIRVALSGGTFNTHAPSFPFLDATWRTHMKALGAPLTLAMPAAGFYPKGGGRLEAWIEPAALRPLVLNQRGALRRIHITAGVSRLLRGIAERMRRRAAARLDALGIDAETGVVEWNGPSPGAALSLTAEYDGAPPVTFDGLGERGKPAETVADEAVDAWLSHHDSPGQGAVDPHSADQLLLPLALTPGRSEFTVSAVTDHLRTNARTCRAFLDRRIQIIEATDDDAGRVIVF